jgi:hypothetical protein
MRAVLSSYVGKHDDPCGDLAIMAYLVPEQWRFEG